MYKSLARNVNALVAEYGRVLPAAEHAEQRGGKVLFCIGFHYFKLKLLPLKVEIIPAGWREYTRRRPPDSTNINAKAVFLN